MQDKFTYSDFLMYVLPGAYLLIIFFPLMLIFDINYQYLKDFEALIIIAFILASFIIGHTIQAISHKKPEQRLKKQHFGGYYPSDIIFFKNNMIIGEKERLDFLNALVKLNILNKTDKEKMADETISKDNSGYAHYIFEKSKNYVLEFDLLGRINQQSYCWVFYRGIWVASYFASLIYLLMFLYLISGHYELKNIIIIHYSTKKIVFCALFALIFFIIGFVFKDRMRGVGKKYALEVCHLLSAVATKK